MLARFTTMALLTILLIFLFDLCAFSSATNVWCDCGLELIDGYSCRQICDSAYNPYGGNHLLSKSPIIPNDFTHLRETQQSDFIQKHLRHFTKLVDDNTDCECSCSTGYQLLPDTCCFIKCLNKKPGFGLWFPVILAVGLVLLFTCCLAICCCCCVKKKRRRPNRKQHRAPNSITPSPDSTPPMSLASVQRNDVALDVPSLSSTPAPTHEVSVPPPYNPALVHPQYPNSVPTAPPMDDRASYMSDYPPPYHAVVKPDHYHHQQKRY